MRRYALVSGGDDRHLRRNDIQRASGGAVPAGRCSSLRERTYVFRPQFARFFLERGEIVIWLVTMIFLTQMWRISFSAHSAAAPPQNSSFPPDAARASRFRELQPWV